MTEVLSKINKNIQIQKILHFNTPTLTVSFMKSNRQALPSFANKMTYIYFYTRLLKFRFG